LPVVDWDRERVIGVRVISGLVLRIVVFLVGELGVSFRVGKSAIDWCLFGFEESCVGTRSRYDNEMEYSARERFLIGRGSADVDESTEINRLRKRGWAFDYR
jgi:hypothetical protein